jgi:hypothetical protein
MRCRLRECGREYVPSGRWKAESEKYGICPDCVERLWEEFRAGRLRPREGNRGYASFASLRRAVVRGMRG